MAQSVYVFAVLGTSVGVLAELLWYLHEMEGCGITGIEVWSTSAGDELLRHAVDGESWDALDALLRLPDLQPAGAEPGSGHGFRSHVFTGPGGPLRDVRSRDESDVVARVLYERLRELRGALDESVQIVGSVAGGRKTISTALQTAFSMQAARRDRLVHVLLSEKLERWLIEERGGLHGYSYPTEEVAEASGVPVEEQVEVYDVVFPRLKLLRNDRLTQLLENRSWADVWSDLDELAGLELKGVLNRTHRWDYKWRLDIINMKSGALLRSVPLGMRVGAVYAAIGSLAKGERAGSEELVRWISEHDVGWKLVSEPDGADPDFMGDRMKAVSRAVHDLRVQLESLPSGLKCFIPVTERGRYRVDARVDVNLEYRPSE